MHLRTWNDMVLARCRVSGTDEREINALSKIFAFIFPALLGHFYFPFLLAIPPHSSLRVFLACESKSTVHTLTAALISVY